MTKTWQEEIKKKFEKRVDFYLSYHKIPKVKATMIKGNLLQVFEKLIEQTIQSTREEVVKIIDTGFDEEKGVWIITPANMNIIRKNE